MANVKLRKAQGSDYQAINSLYHLTYSLYHKHLPRSYHPTPETVLVKEDFQNILDSSDCLMFVAEIEGKIVGMLYAFIDDYDDTPVATDYHRVEVAEISVAPEYAKQGIGTKLMAEAEKWAKDQGIFDLSVLVYAFNEEAISFFKSNDYKPYSIKMEKKLEK